MIGLFTLALWDLGVMWKHVIAVKGAMTMHWQCVFMNLR